jgi:hypothetical protein
MDHPPGDDGHKQQHHAERLITPICAALLLAARLCGFLLGVRLDARIHIGKYRARVHCDRCV